MVNINIQKKDSWLLAAIMVFLVGVTVVIAYGSGASPSVMGHSAEEIELLSCTTGQVLKTNSVGDWECQDDHTIIYETVTTSGKSSFFPACTSPLTIQTLSFSSQGGAIYIAGAAMYVHDGDTQGAGLWLYLYRDATLLETIYNSFLQPGQQRRTSIIYTDFPGSGSYNYYLKGCSDAWGNNDIKAKDRILMIEESLGK